MKMKLVAATIMGLYMSTTALATDAVVLTTEKDRLSYSIGIDLGKNFKKQEVDVNVAALAKGIEDGAAGGKMLLTEQQMKDVLTQFQKEFMAKRAAAFKKTADENQAKGEAFLTTNKAKAGVVTLADGLQYKITTVGTGKKPSKDDSVTVDYTGKLISGEIFDSSSKTGKPATFKLTQVIPGWTEVLQLMPIGSTWEVYVPAKLAYGERGMGGPIGPNETLIFTIHLIAVSK